MRQSETQKYETNAKTIEKDGEKKRERGKTGNNKTKTKREGER